MTYTLTQADLKKWLHGCQRFQHHRESFQAARGRVTSPDHYRKAQLNIFWNKGLLEIDMPVRHSPKTLMNIEAITVHPWPVLFPKWIRATKVDWEVLKPFGNKGFLTRLVLRGFPPGKSGYFTELASVEFLIPYEHPRVFFENGDGSDHVEETGRTWLRDHAPTRLSAKPVTPRTLGSLLGWMKDCQIKTIGVTRVRSLYHAGTVYTLSPVATGNEGGVRHTS